MSDAPLTKKTAIARLTDPKNFDYARDDMGKRVGRRKYMMLSTREAEQIASLLRERPL